MKFYEKVLYLTCKFQIVYINNEEIISICFGS